MKRSAPWESLDGSSDDSSGSDSEDEKLSGKRSSTKEGHPQATKDIREEAPDWKKKRGAINFEALSKHGYRGGPSILKVPPPKPEEQKDWSWSTGKEHRDANKDTTEQIREHERPRGESAHRENILNAQNEASRKDKDKDKAASFSQKEKRKRDLGQASRGKSYVEEEKRLLRDSGVYSGFDT